MSLEDRVITELLNAGTLQPALKVGLAETHFLSPEPRRIYRFLRQHWFNPATSGTLPSINRVKGQWPGFTPRPIEAAGDGQLKGLLDHLKMKSFESNARGMADYFQKLVDEDPEHAVVTIKAALGKLETRMGAHQVEPGMRLGDILSLAEEHYEGSATGAIYGIPWPWHCLTEDTLGKRAGDFTVFYGRMKSMKTWILLYCAAYDFLNHNKRVLVWSREMSKVKLGLRMACLLAGVDYQLFKKGLLPPAVRDRCFEILESLTRGVDAKKDISWGAAHGMRDMLLLTGKAAPRHLDDLKKIIDEFEPDAIYLDSFYHMDSERSAGQSVRWQRTAALAEDIKSYAEDSDLPITAVHQANRDGEKTHGETLSDLADADVIAREADLIVRVLKSPSYQPLNEQEYEVDLQLLIEKYKRNKIRKQKSRKSRMPRIKLARADKRFSDQNHNRMLMERLIAQQEIPRVGGELALVMGGNREGVLEAFIINATPAYDFRVIDGRPSMKTIKEWAKGEDKEDKPQRSNVKRKKGKSKGKDAQKFDQGEFEDAMGG